MLGEIGISTIAGNVRTPLQKGMVQNGANLCTFSNSGDALFRADIHNLSDNKGLSRELVFLA